MIMTARGILWVRAPNVCYIACPGWWIMEHMMTSSNGNIFRVTGHLCGEFTGPLCFFYLRWINGWVNNREAGDLRRYRAHYDVTLMSSAKLNSNSYSFSPLWYINISYITLAWVQRVTSVEPLLEGFTAHRTSDSGSSCVCAQPTRDDVTM